MIQYQYINLFWDVLYYTLLIDESVCLDAATADDEDEFAVSKAYWKEFYISAFDSIIDNLRK